MAAALVRLNTTLALATIVTVVGVVAPASATFEGRNGLLAYATGGGEENYVVWTVRPDGTHHRRLIEPSETRFRRGPADPQWSADGTHLLFGGHHQYDRAAQSLWYSTASGERLTRIPLGLGGPAKGPDAIYLFGWAWGPDGRHVVFAAGHEGEQPRIYTIAIDGTNRRPLRRGAWPEWSSDGRHIVFSRYKVLATSPTDDTLPRETIFVMRPDGSGLRRLTTSTRDTTPTFSPDGRSVVFVREFYTLSPPRPDWRAEWRMVDIAGRRDALLATHYYWADAGQATLAPNYCPPRFAPNGDTLGAFREDRVGVDIWASSFATFSLERGVERTRFQLRRALPGDCHFSWQPR